MLTYHVCSHIISQRHVIYGAGNNAVETVAPPALGELDRSVSLPEEGQTQEVKKKKFRRVSFSDRHE